MQKIERSWKDFESCIMFKILFITSNGQFQKISVQYDRRLFGIPKARGGSLNWNSEGMEGYLRLEFRRHRGVSDLGFPEGTDK